MPVPDWEGVSELELAPYVLLRREVRWLDPVNFDAPLDGVGDDGPAIQDAIDAAADHATIVLPPQVRIATAIVMPTDRNIRVLGAPTRVTIAGDVQAFRILNVNSGDTGRHVFDGLSFEAATPFTGTAFYLENASGQAFRNMKLFSLHTYFHMHNAASNSWCEGNHFENIEGVGYVYGWRFQRTDGNSSMSDHHFIRCKISVNSSADPGVDTFGLHVGTGCSLYRSFFGNLTIFPSVDDATGVYIDGNIHNASGAINIESSAGTVGAVGVELGPNASSSSHWCVFDMVGDDLTPFVQHASSTAQFVVPCTQASNRNGGRWIAAHHEAVMGSVTRADDDEEIWRETFLTNDRRKIYSAQPIEFADMAGTATQGLKAIIFGSAATITSGATPDFANLSDATISMASATNITGFQNGRLGQEVVVLFTNGNATLVHHSTNLKLKGATNYTPAANDISTFRCMASGQWREISRL